MAGVMPRIFAAFNRITGTSGKRGLKFSAGNVALTTSNSSAINTGLKTVLYVVCTTTGATAGYATCVSKTGGSIILKANASLSFDWIAVGY